MNRDTQLSLFLSDARRFILLNRSIIHKAPLQLYSSAIIFTPKESLIRKMFEKPIPWISGLLKVPHAWNSELQKLEGHKRRVNAVAFSPDGQLLASASSDRTIVLWSPATGEFVQHLEGHSDHVNAVVFSADGQLLASASDDKTVRLWNPVTGEQLQRLKGHTRWVNSVVFSADGQLLASASHDKTVRLWNPATAEQVQRLEGHNSCVNAVAFSTDGQLLASASNDKTVRLWNPATGKQVQQLEGHHWEVNAVAFSTDGQLLASASFDHTVKLWNLATGELSQQIADYDVTVRHLRFSSGDQCLETDRGVLKLQSNQSAGQAAMSQTSGTIMMVGDWIIYDKKNLLWLPADYRGSCSAWSGNTLAVGSESGRVIFLQFNIQSIIVSSKLSGDHS
jgi:WD40 repeat protein